MVVAVFGADVEDDQQRRAESDGKANDVDRRVQSVARQIAQRHGQVVAKHLQAPRNGFVSFSTASESTAWRCGQKQSAIQFVKWKRTVPDDRDCSETDTFERSTLLASEHPPTIIGSPALNPG